MQRKSIKDFSKFVALSSNGKNSESDNVGKNINKWLVDYSVSHQDPSEISSSPSQILKVNNASSNHILEVKLPPFNPNKIGRSKTPNHHSNKRINESKKKLNAIAEGNIHYYVENELKSVIRIMICEDDSGLRTSIKRLITKNSEEKKLSVDVEESINGLECLYKIYKDFISGYNFDAILIDECMPFMKGSNCISILKSMHTDGYLNKIKTISISSFEDLETIKYIKSHGCDDILPKPHTKEVISKFLDTLIS